MSESYISQLHGNANKKNRKWRYFIYGVMKRKIQEKNWTRSKQDQLKGSRKWIAWKYNVKTLKENVIIWSNYRWDIEKWIFGKLMSSKWRSWGIYKRWNQNLGNLRNPSYLKQKNLFMRHKQIIYSVFNSLAWWCVWAELYTYIYIYIYI